MKSGFSRKKKPVQIDADSFVKMLCIYNLAMNEASRQLAKHDEAERHPDVIGQEIFQCAEQELYELYEADPQGLRQYVAQLVASIPTE